MKEKKAWITTVVGSSVLAVVAGGLIYLKYEDIGASRQEVAGIRTQIGGARELLKGTSDLEREVIVLRYYHGFGERQIAEVVGTPAGTVKSRLHHAVRRLRNEVGSDDG